MATNSELRDEFHTLTLRQKKQFIEDLRVQQHNSTSVANKQFLDECISEYNGEVTGITSNTSHNSKSRRTEVNVSVRENAAMIPCSECGAEISIKAHACPRCGNPAASRNGGVKNGLIWTQAFMPAIGALFAFGTIVTIIINCVLLSVDSKNIRKAGYDTTQLGSPWLVPIYLYRRAKMFNHGNAYFIVWCVMFGLSFIGFFE